MIAVKCVNCSSYYVFGTDEWAYANDNLVRQVKCVRCRTIMQLTTEEIKVESMDELILSRLP